MYTLRDIFNLIEKYRHSEVCDIICDCEECNLYSWCKMDSYILSSQYILNGEYYG